MVERVAPTSGKCRRPLLTIKIPPQVEDWIQREQQDRDAAIALRDRAEKERDALRRQVKEACIQASGLKKKLRAAEEWAARVGTEKERLAARLAEGEEGSRRARVGLAEAARRLAAQADQIADLKEAARERERDLSDAQARLRQLQTRYEHLQEEVQEHAARFARSQEAARKLVTKLAGLERELDAARAQAAHQLAASEQAAREQTAAARRQEDRAQHAERALQAALKEMTVLMEEADDLRGELQPLREARAGAKEAGGEPASAGPGQARTIDGADASDSGAEAAADGSPASQGRDVARLCSQLAFFRAESVADRIRLQEQEARIHWLEQALTETQAANKARARVGRRGYQNLDETRRSRNVSPVKMVFANPMPKLNTFALHPFTRQESRKAWRSVEASLHAALRSRSAAQQRRLALLQTLLDERTLRIRTQEVRA